MSLDHGDNLDDFVGGGAVNDAVVVFDDLAKRLSRRSFRHASSDGWMAREALRALHQFRDEALGGVGVVFGHVRFDRS